MNQKSTHPAPRAAIADPALVRPDRLAGVPRDPDAAWLDKNENPDPELSALIAKIAAGLPGHAFYGYPELAPLYQKLADFAGVPPERLLLSAGSDGAIRATFEAFIAPGDVVLHTSPTFAMYPVYCRIYGAKVHALEYAPSNDGPALDVETLVAAIEKESPKLVCLPNPDSPTGTVFSPGDLRDIVEAAGRARAVMLIDEAYHPFYPETAIGWIEEYPHLIVTRSTGKAWGMAGLRIGYAAASEELSALLHKVRPMYEIGNLSAAIFNGMLDHGGAMMESVNRLEAGKALFLNAMDDLGFRTLRGQGNFCHVSFGARSEQIHTALKGHVYYRENFSEPCLEGFSRFSSTTPEKIQPVIGRIKAAVGD